jgi:hypothetical protein
MHHPVPYPFYHYMVVRRLSAAPGPNVGLTRRHKRQQIPLEPPKHLSYSARLTYEYVKGENYKMAFSRISTTAFAHQVNAETQISVHHIHPNQSKKAPIHQHHRDPSHLHPLQWLHSPPTPPSCPSLTLTRTPTQQPSTMPHQRL